MPIRQLRYKPGADADAASQVVCRFFLGIGIGGEYPAGSVAAAEATTEVKSGTRNRWFILFTNFSIDVGFVVAALVPLVFLGILGTDRRALMINVLHHLPCPCISPAPVSISAISPVQPVSLALALTQCSGGYRSAWASSRPCPF